MVRSYSSVGFVMGERVLGRRKLCGNVAIMLLILLVPGRVHGQKLETGRESGGKVATSAETNTKDVLDPAVETKVRRLRLAGWPFTIAGMASLAATFLYVYLKDTSNDTEDARLIAVAAGLGPASGALLATGGGLLLRARLLLSRNRRPDPPAQVQHPAESKVTGAALHLRVPF